MLIVLAAGLCLLPAAQAATASSSSSDTSSSATGFSVSSNVTDTLVPGMDSYLVLTIKNLGSADANNLYITLERVDGPIVLEDLGVPRYISSIKASGTAESIYKITVPEDTPAGTYLARFQVTRDVAGGTEKVTVHNAVIRVQGTSNLIIGSLTPVSMMPGEAADMAFSVENRGNTRLSNVEVTWSAADDAVLPLGRDRRTYIPDLSPGETLDVTMPITAKPDVEPGVYSLTFTSTFYSNGKKVTSESTLGMIIGGGTDFGVSAQQTTTGTLAVTVANIGINPAYSVAVKLGPSESFIGSIDAGDYSITSITVPTFGNDSTMTGRETPTQTRSPRNGNWSGSRFRDSGGMKMTISYTDTQGVRREVAKDVSVTPSSSQSTRNMFTGNGNGQMSARQGSGNTTKYIIGAAVLIVVIYLLKQRKKRLP